MELGKARLVLKIRERGVETEVVYEAFDLGTLLSVQLGGDLGLNEDGWTLVEPDVFPSLACDQVAHPAVNDLVDRRCNLTLVTRDHCWRDEGKQWVLHAAKGEGWWQHENIVVSPSIRNADVLLNLIQVGLEAFQFFRCCRDARWLSNNSDSCSKFFSLEVSDCEGDEVRRRLDLIIKLVCFELAILCCACVVGAHLDDEFLRYGHICRIGGLDRRRVLKWRDRSASQELALSEEVRQLLAEGLLRSQPAEGGGLIICGVVHLDGEKCSWCILLRQVDSKSLADIGHHGAHLKLQSLDTICLLAFLRCFCFGLTAFFRLFALGGFGAILSLFELFARFLLRVLLQLQEAAILGLVVGTVWDQLHFLDFHSLYVENNLRNGFGLGVLVETSDLHFVLDDTFNYGFVEIDVESHMHMLRLYLVNVSKGEAVQWIAGTSRASGRSVTLLLRLGQ